jgi:hypothetical protein
MSEEGIQKYYKVLCSLFDCPSVYQLNVSISNLYDINRCWSILARPAMQESEEMRTARWLNILCFESLNLDIHCIPQESATTHPSLSLADYKVFHQHRLLNHPALPHLAYLHWLLLSFCVLYRKAEFRQANSMKLNDWFLNVVIFGDAERFAILKNSVRDYFTLLYYHYTKE